MQGKIPGRIPLFGNGATKRIPQDKLPHVSVVANPEMANENNPNGIGIGTNMGENKAVMIAMLSEAIRLLAMQLHGKSANVVMPDGSPAPLPTADSMMVPEPTAEQQSSE